MSLKLTAACLTDVGQKREHNEDTVGALVADDGETGLFIVADGMGGHRAGEVASRLVVNTIQSVLKTSLVAVAEQLTVKLAPLSEQETLRLKPFVPKQTTSGLRAEKNGERDKTRRLPEAPQARGVEEHLKAVIRQANQALATYGETHRDAQGMGCTITMALVDRGQAHIANVGDSRTYLLRQGQLVPLTRDHSLVAKLIEAKQIQPDDIYTHPGRNLIYQSLGAGHHTVNPDIFHETLQAGDRLLLCSDGLWEMVRPPALLKALSAPVKLETICQTLIDLANAGGGEDNIGVVVVQVQ